ncbi:MAG: hypothetical protein HUJ90_05600 [Bacteroidales bacterium]|nr:hypothetical protein [Bacteroidales bacterium]
MKLARILKWLLLGISVALLVVFFVSPHDTVADPMVDTFLYWVYALVFAALIVLIAFLLIKTFSSKKGILNFLLLIVGIVVLVGGVYFLAPGGEVATTASYTEGVSKFSDAALYLVYVMVAGTIVALVGSGIVNAVKNR